MSYVRFKMQKEPSDELYYILLYCIVWHCIASCANRATNTDTNKNIAPSNRMYILYYLQTTWLIPSIAPTAYSAADLRPTLLIGLTLLIACCLSSLLLFYGLQLEALILLLLLRQQFVVLVVPIVYTITILTVRWSGCYLLAPLLCLLVCLAN